MRPPDVRHVIGVMRPAVLHITGHDDGYALGAITAHGDVDGLPADVKRKRLGVTDAAGNQ